MRKTLKMIGVSLLAVVVIITIIGALFLNFNTRFGTAATKEQQVEYAQSGHFKDGKFVNRIPTFMTINTVELIKKMFQKAPNRKPNRPISVEKLDSAAIVNHQSNISSLTWFGHSTFLLEIDGKKILIDPMFSESPSPLPFIGPKRYSKDLPIELEKLPYIDAVILSHDHYDHLDYQSIQKLKKKVGHYFTPLGVGNHLVGWGVPKEKVSELNWWDSINFEGVELVCSPSRHFSGRGLFDRASTLWCSWVIVGKEERIFFSGDSGYDTHFKEIGEKYGPFDISLVECGQYNTDWKAFHMMPEETAQAAVDLKSKLAMPIHWGAFSLAFHDWTDPIERVSKKAKELNLPITTPKIGETITIGTDDYPTGKWWIEYVVKN